MACLSWAYISPHQSLTNFYTQNSPLVVPPLFLCVLLKGGWARRGRESHCWISSPGPRFARGPGWRTLPAMVCCSIHSCCCFFREFYICCQCIGFSLPAKKAQYRHKTPQNQLFGPSSTDVSRWRACPGPTFHPTNL